MISWYWKYDIIENFLKGSNFEEALSPGEDVGDFEMMIILWYHDYKLMLKPWLFDWVYQIYDKITWKVATLRRRWAQVKM